jgi:hypothetical protein
METGGIELGSTLPPAPELERSPASLPAARKSEGHPAFAFFRPFFAVAGSRARRRKRLFIRCLSPGGQWCAKMTGFRRLASV